MLTTQTDRGATAWRIEDPVIRLREWSSDIAYRLPEPPVDSLMVGTADTCTIRLVDPSGHTSREHARIERHKVGWVARDLGSKNGMRLDGARRPLVPLQPGVELGIGNMTLIAESLLFIELRNFLARLLGWTSDKMATVDLALRAIRLSATRRVPLVLSGEAELPQVARAIHRHVIGNEQPFVVCDPRRRDSDTGVRVAANTETGMAALQRAEGGSMCVWSKRLPRDFAEVRLALRDPAAHVQLIVCVDSPRQSKPFHVEPIVVPSLKSRTSEVARIIAEYADEAAVELAATVRLNAADRAWVLRCSASSVSEIEKGTRRLLAIRQHRQNVTAAAKALGMAPVSLARWIGRRGIPDSGKSTGARKATTRPDRQLQR